MSKASKVYVSIYRFNHIYSNSTVCLPAYLFLFQVMATLKQTVQLNTSTITLFSICYYNNIFLYVTLLHRYSTSKRTIGIELELKHPTVD